MNDQELIDIIKNSGIKTAILEYHRVNKVSLSESESKVNELSNKIGLKVDKIKKTSNNKVLYIAAALFLLGSLSFMFYENNKHQNKLEDSNIVVSKSPDDQARFEQEDKQIYNDMCATENSYKRSDLENKLSQHRASVGYVKDWFFTIETVSEGVLDKDLNYDKSLFTIDVRSESGLACTLYIDPNDSKSMEIVKQLDKGDNILVCGDFSWSGMIAGFTLKNARIKGV
jgi:hypothetical protein